MIELAIHEIGSILGLTQAQKTLQCGGVADSCAGYLISVLGRV